MKGTLVFAAVLAALGCKAEKEVAKEAGSAMSRDLETIEVSALDLREVTKIPSGTHYAAVDGDVAYGVSVYEELAAVPPGEFVKVGERLLPELSALLVSSGASEAGELLFDLRKMPEVGRFMFGIPPEASFLQLAWGKRRGVPSLIQIFGDRLSVEKAYGKLRKSSRET